IWPAGVSSKVRDQLRVAANLVSAATNELHDVSGLTDDQQEVVESWEADIAALILQAQAHAATQRVVRLPGSLSASQLIALETDPAQFLKTLVRPMPRQPSSAADRGTAFHSWVETFYGKRALIDAQTLPGAMDDEIYSDDQLQKLKAAFEAGPFFARTPIHLELPFALVLGGRTLRGRLDGLFKGTSEDPNAPDRWVVVDWKTGKPGSANDLQLSIYRQAAALSLGVSPEKVEAVFYYVADQIVEKPKKLLSIPELAELIS
ncbi:MAG: PD-(D/E)XK nuclease family protein, partial [Burkholderiaceae bacterium]|nr:PD-(D/E)XK nuclease family protein [Burkholderiaceae bacterium]